MNGSMNLMNRSGVSECSEAVDGCCVVLRQYSKYSLNHPHVLQLASDHDIAWHS
jgi:hypothetical protein